MKGADGYASRDSFPTLNDFRSYLQTQIRAHQSAFQSKHAERDVVELSTAHRAAERLAAENVGLHVPWRRLVKSVTSNEIKLYLLESEQDVVLVTSWFNDSEVAFSIPKDLVKAMIPTTKDSPGEPSCSPA